MTDFPNRWMWSEACDMLAQADRLHRELFRPGRAGKPVPLEPKVYDTLSLLLESQGRLVESQRHQVGRRGAVCLRRAHHGHPGGFRAAL